MTLHAGFQFGWNVHTLAYALMCLVVASGVVGTVLYLRYPAQMSAQSCRHQTASRCSPKSPTSTASAAPARDGASAANFRTSLMSARDRTVLGGSAFALLAGRDRSRVVLPSPTAGGIAPAAAAAEPVAARLLDWLGAGSRATPMANARARSRT